MAIEPVMRSASAPRFSAYRLQAPGQASLHWNAIGGRVIRHRQDTVWVDWSGDTRRLEAQVAVGACSETITLEESVTAVQTIQPVPGRLFPQPAGQEATLELATPLSQAAQLEVLSASGQVLLIQSAAAGSHSLQLHLEALPAGLYALRLAGGGQAGSWRLLKR